MNIKSPKKRTFKMSLKTSLSRNKDGSATQEKRKRAMSQEL